MILQALLDRILCISVDGLFFPEQLEIISAHVILTSEEKKLRSCDFTSTVALPYQNAYVAKLCSALAIFKVLE